MTDHFSRRLAHETDCADVHAALGDPDLVLLDVRAASDHAARHLPGALSLPHRQITAAALAGFAPGTRFVTYCWGPHCNGATKGAAAVAALGHDVVEMLGGVWGWEQEGFAFETETETETTTETETETRQRRHRVGLLAFDGCDAMDLVGPYEVLLTADRLRARQGLPARFEVVVLGAPEVAAFGGLGLRPHTTVAEAGPLDVLVVPGAIDLEQAHPEAAVRLLAEGTPLVASVCTGAFFLQRAGLLEGVAATTHWEDVGALAGLGVSVRADVRWVDSGRVVTSGGISSGIAMALHLVARLVSTDLAEAVARQIDYAWTERR